jgi:hypothetical protein
MGPFEFLEDDDLLGVVGFLGPDNAFNSEMPFSPE